MKIKKVPLRMCIGCQEMKPKKELLRIVRSNEGLISIDLTGKKPGRGSYICKNAECFEKAKKGKKLERTYECAVPPEIYNSLKAEVEGIDAK